ncbi:MAG: FkbM family methyltransferase [Simkaniaceae bacterium]|nr:FkbM family methyltransferase [Candidatus Sacchlamyda saccharinae]
MTHLAKKKCVLFSMTLFFLYSIFFPMSVMHGKWGLRGNIGTGTTEDPYYNLSAHYISQFLPQNPIVIEAGAHDGEDTYLMSLLWPEGQIYAFEPDPRTYPELMSNLNDCKNVHTFPIALGTYVGTSNFYLSKPTEAYGVAGQSSLFPDNPETWPWSWVEIEEQPITVPITTLDDWAEKHGIQKVDFLWLDMQGSEYQMLQASPRILKTVTAIKTEYSTKEYYKGTVLFSAFKQFLEEQGFYLIEICGETHGDALFIRKD